VRTPPVRTPSNAHHPPRPRRKAHFRVDLEVIAPHFGQTTAISSRSAAESAFQPTPPGIDRAHGFRRRGGRVVVAARCRLSSPVAQLTATSLDHERPLGGPSDPARPHDSLTHQGFSRPRRGPANGFDAGTGDPVTFSSLPTRPGSANDRPPVEAMKIDELTSSCS